MEYYDRLTDSQESTGFMSQSQLRTSHQGYVGVDPKASFPPAGPVNHPNDRSGMWCGMLGDDSKLPWPQNQGFRVPGVSGCRNGRSKSRSYRQGGPPLWSAGPCLLGVTE